VVAVKGGDAIKEPNSAVKIFELVEASHLT
jgi:hypothetical protein